MPEVSAKARRRGKRAAVASLAGLLLGALAALGVIPPAVVQPVVEAVDPLGELFGLK